MLIILKYRMYSHSLGFVCNPFPPPPTKYMCQQITFIFNIKAARLGVTPARWQSRVCGLWPSFPVIQTALGELGSIVKKLQQQRRAKNAGTVQRWGEAFWTMNSPWREKEGKVSDRLPQTFGALPETLASVSPHPDCCGDQCSQDAWTWLRTVSAMQQVQDATVSPGLGYHSHSPNLCNHIHAWALTPQMFCAFL